MVKLTRAKENPILTPSNLSWENRLVFNPGAVVSKDIVYLLYRARGKNESTSRFGLSTSHDGIHFERREKPVYFAREEKFRKLGVEDPRIVKINDMFFITFTIVSENPQGKINPNWPELINMVAHIAMISTKDFRSFHEHGIILPYIVGKNASLFPKKINGEYWFLYRNDPTKILYRSPEPIFEPETDYETFGFVPNVVFTCGAIEKGGIYYVYYGAADRVIGVATVEKKLVLNLF